jgi:hypothetical protein
VTVTASTAFSCAKAPDESRTADAANMLELSKTDLKWVLRLLTGTIVFPPKVNP